MPTYTRTTVTTTGTATFRSSTIPIWVIKLLTVILTLIILLLLYWIIYKSYTPKTFIIIGLTCGFLLGWSIGSVLQQVFFMRTVEILVNIILTALTILSLILVVVYLIDGAPHSNDQKYMYGIGACFLMQTIVCVLMLSWAWYGNIVIIQSS